MRQCSLLALGVLALAIGQAHAQSTSCESYKDGDATVTVCEGDGHKSVMRCDTSGCRSSSLEDYEDSIEDLRKFCNAALEEDCAKVGNSCEFRVERECGKLASRVDINKKVYGDQCNGIIPQFKWITSAECSKQADEAKLNDELLARYDARKHDKFTADTLKACDKGILDKPYCDDFKKKVAQKSNKAKKVAPEHSPISPSLRR